MSKYFVSDYEVNDMPILFDKKEVAAEYCICADLHSFSELKDESSLELKRIWIINKKENGYDLNPMDWEEVLKFGHGCPCNECKNKSY